MPSNIEDFWKIKIADNFSQLWVFSNQVLKYVEEMVLRKAKVFPASSQIQRYLEFSYVQLFNRSIDACLDFHLTKSHDNRVPTSSRSSELVNKFLAPYKLSLRLRDTLHFYGRDTLSALLLSTAQCTELM